ncbi:MAG: hypothetical protein JW855_02245 [Gammaproteobacteria bacterium]|nr:hypothetical protein [Gammaproteobacteria bacterium]
MFRKLFVAFLVGLSISTSFAAAQDPLYKVDLLVFTHITDQALASENWPDELLTPSLQNVEALSTDPSEHYQLLSEDQFGLKNQANRLTKNSDYKIILQQSWVQPISNQHGKWVHIFGGQNFNENNGTDRSRPVPIPIANKDIHLEGQSPKCDSYWELNGKIKLSKIGYYFNVYTRLYLTEPKTSLGGSGSDESPIGTFQPVPFRTFKLFEDRRTPVNTLNYIDHPLFGILLKITTWNPNTSGTIQPHQT